MNKVLQRIPYLFEILRIVLVILGYNLAYSTSDYGLALSYLVGLVVIPLTGLTALESLFFTKAAAIAKSRDVSPYQIQSACNNLAVALTAAITLLFDWQNSAKIAVITVAIIFFLLSGIQHLREAIQLTRQKHLGSKMHWQRFALSILLFVVTLHLLIAH